MCKYQTFSLFCFSIVTLSLGGRKVVVFGVCFFLICMFSFLRNNS